MLVRVCVLFVVQILVSLKRVSVSDLQCACVLVCVF
jgi:hypothetical protein